MEHWKNESDGVKKNRQVFVKISFKICLFPCHFRSKKNLSCILGFMESWRWVFLLSCISYLRLVPHPRKYFRVHVWLTFNVMLILFQEAGRRALWSVNGPRIMQVGYEDEEDPKVMEAYEQIGSLVLYTHLFSLNHNSLWPVCLDSTNFFRIPSIVRKTRFLALLEKIILRK